MNLFFLKKKKRLCFYGYEQLNDNTRSLIEYIINDKKYTRYEIFLVSKENPIRNKKVIHVQNKILGLYYIFTSSYIFHAQGMGQASLRSCYKQLIVNIWHGAPLKSIGNNIKSKENSKRTNSDDFCVISSLFFKDIYKSSFNYSENQLIVAGNPRNDYLFKNTNLKKLFKLPLESKIILFMPTFRKSNNMQYIDSTIDLPIINESNITEINDKLNNLNQYLFFKPHPYQLDINIFHKNFSNIILIDDHDLDQMNLRLYTLIGNSDALITDYSSVYFDYLLVDKPIGFTIPDINEYKRKRGFSVNDPESLMPGVKIKTKQELIKFFISLSKEEDYYSKDRNRISKLVNHYSGEEHSKYLLEKLDIGRSSNE